MFISEHKRSQIEAGANPKDVLTPAELTAYNEALEAQSSEEGTENQAAAGETDAAEGLEASEETAEETTEASTAPAGESKVPMIEMSEYRKVVRESASFEQKLEAAQARLEELEADISKLNTRNAALHDVAAVAVDKLNIALRKPAKVYASSDALVAEFNSLQAEMASRFGSAQTQQSKGPGTKESSGYTNIPAAFRHLKK